MSGLRLLLRTAPFIVGVLAAAVWLRRRARERPALERPEEPKLLLAPEPIDIVTIVDDLLVAGRT